MSTNDDRREPGDPVTGFLRQFTSMTAGLYDLVNAGLTPIRTWVREHEADIKAFAYAAAQASMPPNWNGLTPDQTIKIMRLTLRHDGTPLAWLPPASVLGPMLDMDSLEQRDPIMLKHQAVVREGARELLNEVTNPDLQELRFAVERAWDAWDAGHRHAAQALAAASLTGVIQAPAGLKIEYLSDLRKQLERARRDANGNLNPATIGWSMRELATFTAVATALRTDNDRLGQPGFNRHLTCHSVSATQYTDANALKGLTIATAALRELQWLRAHPLRPPLLQAAP